MIFIGYIIVSCIQLGATVDYAILTTNNYLECRKTMDKKEAAIGALNAWYSGDSDIRFDPDLCRIYCIQGIECRG